MILFQIPSAPLLLGQVLKEASPFHIGQVVPRQGKQSPDDRRERAKVGEGTGSLVRFEMLEAYLSYSKMLKVSAGQLCMFNIIKISS